MRIAAREMIDSFMRKHPDARSFMESWYQEVLGSSWENTMDIKNRYQSASFLGDNIVIFNIKGNKYRLAVKIAYKRQTVLVKWAGTHSEYSRKEFP